MSDCIIETRGLTKRYGDQVSVSNLDLHVQMGRIYGLLGRNGAGKTTTMKMLLGLTAPTSGTVSLFGQPLKGNETRILPRIGSLIESPGFYPNLTGTENLQIFARLRGLKSPNYIKSALELVNLPYAGIQRCYPGAQHSAVPSGHGGCHRLDCGALADVPPQQQGSAGETEEGQGPGPPADWEDDAMRKSRKRWRLLLTCGLLCALLLSGCSGMMQALADGTDAVLNGLAEGTDQVAGALADMTDAALGAAADATDDSVKDALVDAYGSLVDTAGSWALMPDRSLQGERVPGEDDYTGTYAADYDDFSGTELLFGGTTLDREAGNMVELTCSLDIEEGEAAIFLCSGSEEPVLLLSESGDYSDTIEVGGGSVYLGVWAEGVTGSVSIQIE